MNAAPKLNARHPVGDGFGAVFRSVVIDGLVIRLVNPQCGLIACSNPVGLDNIVVGY